MRPSSASGPGPPAPRPCPPRWPATPAGPVATWPGWAPSRGASCPPSAWSTRSPTWTTPPGPSPAAPSWTAPATRSGWWSPPSRRPSRWSARWPCCSGRRLPAADTIGPLLEGYGLYVAGGPDVDEQLRELDLPPLAAADGELAAAMALSFVRYLVARGGQRRLPAHAGQRAARPSRRRRPAGVRHRHGCPRGGVAPEAGRGPARHEDRASSCAWRCATCAPISGESSRCSCTCCWAWPSRWSTRSSSRTCFDKAIPSGHYSQVLTLLGVLTIAFVITALANLRGSYVEAWVSGSVVRQLRQEMFAKMQHLSQGWYNQHQQGDVLSRMFSDVGMLEQGLSQTLRGGLVQILTLGVSATVLIILDPWLALIVLLGAPDHRPDLQGDGQGGPDPQHRGAGGDRQRADRGVGELQRPVRGQGLRPPAARDRPVPPVQRSPLRPPASSSSCSAGCSACRCRWWSPPCRSSSWASAPGSSCTAT